MANKTTLTSAINGFITAVVSVAKVRNAFLELIDTFFSTTIVKSNAVAVDQYTYELKFNKRGNKVHVTGFIRNDYSIAVSFTNIFVNDVSELFCKTGNNTFFFAQGLLSNQNMICLLEENTLAVNDTFPSGETLIINTNYITND